MTEKYICLNCGESIEFNESLSTTCSKCSWRNDLAEDPVADISPIVMKIKIFEDFLAQVCYPLIEEKDLKEIPDALREAIMHYFKDPDNYEKKDYENIYHNLYRKDTNKFKQLGVKYLNKYKLAVFFKNTNFIK